MADSRLDTERKNWGSVYEQAINEHRERKGVKA